MYENSRGTGRVDAKKLQEGNGLKRAEHKLTVKPNYSLTYSGEKNPELIHFHQWS